MATTHVPPLTSSNRKSSSTFDYETVVSVKHARTAARARVACRKMRIEGARCNSPVQQTAMSRQAVRGGLGNQSAYLIRDCLIVAVFTCRAALCSTAHRGP